MSKERRVEIYLLFEFILLFLAVPLIVFFEANMVHPSKALLPFVILVVLILHYSHGFKWKELWRFRVERQLFLRHLGIVILVALLMAGWVYLFDRENLFNLPRSNSQLWIMVIILYPVFSAFTQEVIYRTFIFRRYHKVFKNELPKILASALVFSFVHLFYYHAASMILTFILGVYLGWIYTKTKSILFTTIIHGLMGIAVFSVGLGHYFWIDMQKWL
ncbi:MAG: CPBP family intramembrane glutamic endopeptidase [Prolixibacteraceae bacterium]